MKDRLLSLGAEAEVFLTTYYGRKAVLKKRKSKSYREKELDRKIIKERAKEECILLHRAKLAGLKTPAVWKISRDFSVIMEYLEGKTLKDEIMEGKTELIEKAGESVGILHENNIIHGDLTTSNFIVQGKELAVIDFGLGFFSSKYEDKAVDLLNFKKTFLSIHFDFMEKWQDFQKGYEKTCKDAKHVLKQIKKVEERARYY